MTTPSDGAVERNSQPISNLLAIQITKNLSQIGWVSGRHETQIEADFYPPTIFGITIVNYEGQTFMENLWCAMLLRAEIKSQPLPSIIIQKNGGCPDFFVWNSTL